MVDHILLACQRQMPAQLSREREQWLCSVPHLCLLPSFHAGIRLKMSYRFPPVSIAETDKVPSQEENKML